MNAPLKTTAEAATDFVRRHIGPSPRDIRAMLNSVGASSLGELMSQTLPSSIRQKAPLDLGTAFSETEALAHMREIAAQAKSKSFFVDAEVHPQTLAVLRTRAEPLGWNLIVGDPLTDLEHAEVFGGLLQYPGTSGAVRELRPAISALHAKGALAVIAADLLALSLIASPGELGADIA